ncbi:hypothetical protein F3Y22_tig00110893pilonHSYRG00557 [Hibiscus syriacus]|uniref:Uncharacterized protein n=1 Tax=Hibiscus syriacus TaxID=106335 RepID=A0A6A2ZFL7_HIBSY|nr:hypothetical protein F3Y22_tig00110893pilonHSYRG00557 [Hibiscus syriacus]
MNISAESIDVASREATTTPFSHSSLSSHSAVSLPQPSPWLSSSSVSFFFSVLAAEAEKGNGGSTRRTRLSVAVTPEHQISYPPKLRESRGVALLTRVRDVASTVILSPLFHSQYGPTAGSNASGESSTKSFLRGCRGGDTSPPFDFEAEPFSSAAKRRSWLNNGKRRRQKQVKRRHLHKQTKIVVFLRRSVSSSCI